MSIQTALSVSVVGVVLAVAAVLARDLHSALMMVMMSSCRTSRVLVASVLAGDLLLLLLLLSLTSLSPCQITFTAASWVSRRGVGLGLGLRGATTARPAAVVLSLVLRNGEGNGGSSRGVVSTSVCSFCFCLDGGV